MKIISWFLTFAFAAAVNTILNDFGVAYSLAVLISSGNKDQIALFAGLFAGIIAVACYGFAFFFGKKISKRIDQIRFQKAAMKSGLSEFDYAKSITPEKVLAFCERHINDPVHVVTDKLNQLPEYKITSRPCADALIEGYTKLMEQKKGESDIFDDPNIRVNWRDQ